MDVKPPLTLRFFRIFYNELWKVVWGRIVDGILFAAAFVYAGFKGKLSVAAWRSNVLDALIPFIYAMCAVVVVHLVRTGILLVREISSENSAARPRKITSEILRSDGRPEERWELPILVKYHRVRTSVLVLFCSLIPILLSFLSWRVSARLGRPMTAVGSTVVRPLGPGTGPLTESDPQLLPTSWSFLAPSESPNKMLNFRIATRNYGQLDITETRMGGMICTTTRIFTSVEEYAHMKVAREGLYRAPSNMDPLVPRVTTRTFDVSSSEMEGDKELKQMLNRKTYIYFFLVFRTRDGNTPAGLYATREYCGYFYGTKSTFNSCHGTDISYMSHLLDN